MDVRKSEHAGSWYSDSKGQLTAQLDGWLAQVPGNVPGIGEVPIAGARVVISPHAGYEEEHALSYGFC
jgi:MEMO1 family protein